MNSIIKDIRFARARARGGWDLRHRLLLGNTTDTRDRHSHGARRANRKRAEFDHEERICARVHRDRDWCRWRVDADEVFDDVAVWCDADGSRDVPRCVADLFCDCDGRVVDSGFKSNACGSA